MLAVLLPNVPKFVIKASDLTVLAFETVFAHTRVYTELTPGTSDGILVFKDGRLGLLSWTNHSR